MNFAKACSGLALIHTISPPTIHVSDLQLTAIIIRIITRANQIGKAMLLCVGIVEFHPRCGDVIRCLGEVTIAILSIGNINVIKPNMVGSVFYCHSINAIFAFIIGGTGISAYCKIAKDDIVFCGTRYGNIALDGNAWSLSNDGFICCRCEGSSISSWFD